jgi:hypothetical protein
VPLGDLAALQPSAGADVARGEPSRTDAAVVGVSPLLVQPWRG